MNTPDPDAHFYVAYKGIPTIFHNIYSKRRDAYLTGAQPDSDEDWLLDVGQDFVPYITALCPAGVDPERWFESLRMPYHYWGSGPDQAAMAYLRCWFDVRFPDLTDFIANDEHSGIYNFFNGIDNEVTNSRQIPRSEIDPALLAPVAPQAA